MEKTKKNKMATVQMNKLIWKMGLPMIISMVLQALYNVIDSIFVTNMGSDGVLANEALTYTFPIQILIIAVGVGTGVGLNALLSKSLGEGNKDKASKIAGTGIFLSFILYAIFLIFGLFGANAFVKLFSNNVKIIEMGTVYLRIVCCLSLGSIGYTIYERLLQATGKTNLSTISQISGALTNVILDYVFIYPLHMGVAGAAWATIIGQFLSLFLAMYFHYSVNKEIDGNIKYIKWNYGLIKGIYSIGVSAAIMQALLAVMMAGMNVILATTKVDTSILVGSFGIYYKIQQVALFSAFGLSNTIISVLSFNYGMRDKTRVDECIKYGIIDTVIVMLFITVAFQMFAYPLANLFGLAGTTSTEIIDLCTKALRIASIGYVFMGISISIQGVLQSIRYALKPLIISLLRLVIFMFPIAYLFTKTSNVSTMVWLSFPIVEFLTSIISLLILKDSYNKKITVLKDNTVSESKGNNLIVCISREHGTNGKRIAEDVSKRVNLQFYDKEEIKNYAIDNKLISNMSNEDIYDNFLSLAASSESIIKQNKIIKKIAKDNSCVFVGRAADYVLKNNKNIISIFLYAPMDYKVKNIMHNYKDNKKEAEKNIIKSDKSRSKYYEVVANQKWGNKCNYDLCINCSIGNDLVEDIIVDYINKKM